MTLTEWATQNRPDNSKIRVILHSNAWARLPPIFYLSGDLYCCLD